jgi:hypothetical protein
MSVGAATRWVSTKLVGLFLMPAREIAALPIPMTYGIRLLDFYCSLGDALSITLNLIAVAESASRPRRTPVSNTFHFETMEFASASSPETMNSLAPAARSVARAPFCAERGVQGLRRGGSGRRRGRQLAASPHSNLYATWSLIAGGPRVRVRSVRKRSYRMMTVAPAKKMPPRQFLAARS